ncbi:MAG: potassium-transporting ATPase subunit KdpA, partial [Spirochaetota bacterium]
MRSQDLAEITLLAVCAIGSAPFLGGYMARVYRGENRPPFFLSSLERFVFRITGIDASQEMQWRKYAAALVSFSLVSTLFLMGILMLQGFLPLNPEARPGMSWHQALNTAVSFVTNTNWQSYSGEVALGYFVQAVGLAVQNFLSASAGMSVAVALIRGLVAKRGDPASPVPPIGNFWVDMTRTVVYILLPLSLVGALVLVSQGVVQSLAPYVPAVSLEGKPGFIPLGPAASQTIIKHLGTNGGGFFGPNSAFPFENPTPFSNFFELFAEILIPFAFPFLFGSMTGRKKQGRVIFGVMLALLVPLIIAGISSELRWGTLEGKELRFGVGNSALFGVLTTATSTGAVNSMHDSLSPLAGMVAMLDIMLGEVAFGGVGSGLYGMLALVFITVFIAGLMVGRGPEYLGKKIENRDGRRQLGDDTVRFGRPDGENRLQ